MENEEKQFSNPSARWHSVEETHGGCLLGGDPATMKELRCESKSGQYGKSGYVPDSDPSW